MRLDRLITLNLVQPLRRIFYAGSRLVPGRSSRMTCVPILMYHTISDDPGPGVHPYHQTNTSPAMFRQQMRYLADNGYRTISLEGALKLLGGEPPRRARGDAPYPEKDALQVVITFDDGFRDFYTHAFPILQEFGFTATMFLATAFIGDERRTYAPKVGSRSHPPHSIGRECLTWKEVGELHELGIEIGSHTVNHPRLVELPWPEIELELRNSKCEIETRMGEPVTTFAYPYAFPQADRSFATTFRKTLEDAGYDCNVTTEIGRIRAGDDPYRLKRLPVNSCDDPELLRSKLEGGYDWLAMPQRIVKKLKRWTKASGARTCARPRAAEVASH